jgi:hypothetical protein
MALMSLLFVRCKIETLARSQYHARRRLPLAGRFAAQTPCTQGQTRPLRRVSLLGPQPGQTLELLSCDRDQEQIRSQFLHDQIVNSTAVTGSQSLEVVGEKAGDHWLLFVTIPEEK